MKVKMLTQECGPKGNFAPGEERSVSDDHGRELLAARAAVDITPKAVEQAVALPAETAVVVAQEAAVAPPVENRKQGKRNK
jgi:hypothetical protein